MVWLENIPLSRVLSEGGGGVVGKVERLGNIPLCLAFCAREGGDDVVDLSVSRFVQGRVLVAW